MMIHRASWCFMVLRDDSSRNVTKQRVECSESTPFSWNRRLAAGPDYDRRGAEVCHKSSGGRWGVRARCCRARPIEAHDTPQERGIGLRPAMTTPPSSATPFTMPPSGAGRRARAVEFAKCVVDAIRIELEEQLEQVHSFRTRASS